MNNNIVLFFLLFPVLLSAASSKSDLNGWTIGASVYYPVTGRVFDFSGKVMPAGTSLTGSFEFDSQPSPYVYFKRSKPNSLGFSMGYEMIPETTLTGGTVKVGNSKNSATTFSTLQSFEVGVVHIGTEYRTSRLYIPAELLLILVPSYTFKPNSLQGCRGAGLGYSAGIGYLLTRYMNVELNYRSVSMSYCEILGIGNNPPKNDYGTMTSNEAVLSVGFYL